MSLTSFIKIKRIREAFDQYATEKRTPDQFKKLPTLVEDAKGPQGCAGSSFDYLARLHIARILRGSKIDLYQRQWISEYVQDRLYPNSKGNFGYNIGENERWHAYLNDAHREARAYINGDGSLEWLSVLVQYMANTDLFMRTMMGPNMEFDASGRVARELIAMIKQFDFIKTFNPQNTVILNPEFAIGFKVGGADGDLIIDDRLIEFKTIQRLAMGKSTLLQLAGYAVLHDLGGVKIKEEVYTKPLKTVGAYFARQNVLIEIPIAELFPGDGYKQFKTVFEEEVEAREAKLSTESRKYRQFLLTRHPFEEARI